MARKKSAYQTGSRRGGFFGSLFRFFFRSSIFLALVGGLALLATLGYYAYRASDSQFRMADLGRMPERSVVLDSKGQVLGKLHGANRQIIKLDEVSDDFITALLDREDRNFRNHRGVDYRGVARALVRNIKDREFVQGASTLTMQLARNSYGLTEKSIDRKLVEVMVARRIERANSKDQILEHYVNRIFFGTGLYGIERASRAYFSKPASDLTLSESCMLVGIIRSPNRFSPFRNFEGAIRERDTVINRMEMLGSITPTQAEAARQETIVIRTEPPVITQESFAMDAVRRDLDHVLDLDNVEDGGLTIHTTLDTELQQAAVRALDGHLSTMEKTPGYRHPTRQDYEATWTEGMEKPTNYLQGAVVVLDNETGGIRATVGGRNYKHSKYNRALQARRQVGSTFKPFVYATAYEFGQVHPDMKVSDGPIQPNELEAFGVRWSPQNSDGRFGRYPLPVADGLRRSRNTMSVRVGLRGGLDNVIKAAVTAGLAEDIHRGPTAFLGTFESTVQDVTSAYSIFPNEGFRKRPFLITRIENAEGEVLFRTDPLAYSVISEGAASLVNDTLEEVVVSGTASSAKSLGWTGTAAGKTGTTNDYHDAWFVGYTNRLTCGVWVGFDQPKRIMSRGYGSKLALPVWVDVMKKATSVEGFEPGPLPAGPPRVSAVVCRESGGIPTHECERAGTVSEILIPEDIAENRSACSLTHVEFRPPPAARPYQQRPQVRPPVARPYQPRPGFWGSIRNLFR